MTYVIHAGTRSIRSLDGNIMDICVKANLDFAQVTRIDLLPLF